MKKPQANSFTPKPLALWVALALTSTSAIAQESNAEEVEKSNLETITVTAQKRTQNLQEVPVSVTAFSGEELDQAVIKDVYDLQTSVPGFTAFQSQSATNSGMSIRGVATSSQNFGLESSVGLYVDGVYRARQNSMINNLVDVEAVEILRGPQGTLFGKNTPSGALLIRNVAPSHDEDDGFFGLSIGNYGLVNWAGAKSLSAIEDVLAFRVTAFGGSRDGVVDDVNLGDGLLNDRNRWGMRLQALYTPNDDLSVRIIADHAEIDEICCAAAGYLSNFSSQNVPGRFGSDAIVASLGGTLLPDGDGVFDRKVAQSFAPISRMKDKGISTEINYRVNENVDFVSISAFRSFETYDFVDADFTDIDLFSTTNDGDQSSFSQEFRIDYSGDNLNYILGFYYFRQELNLDWNLATYDDLNGFITAGFPAAFDDLVFGINALSAATSGIVAPFADPAPSRVNFSHRAEQDHENYAIFGQLDYQLNDQWILTAGLRFTNEAKDMSTVFNERMANGQGTPAFFSSIGNPAVPETIVPGTALYGAAVAGAALQGIQSFLGTIDTSTPQGQTAFFNFLASEDGKQALAAIAPFQTPGWGFQALSALTSSRSDLEAKLNDDRVSGTIKLSYQPDADSLYYVSYGTGYKSGGTNTDRIGEGLEPVFDAELSKSFEMGMKKDFPEQDFRLNAAIYYSEVTDFQANTFTGAGFNLQNAGDFELSGLELEATWVPLDSVEVKFSYSRTNAEYKTFLRGSCWIAYEFHNTPDGAAPADPGQEGTLAAPNPYCNRSGDRPDGQPEDFYVLKVKKDFELSDSVYAYVMADWSYYSEAVGDGTNDPLTMQDDYSLLNLRFFMSFDEYDTDLIFWGRNVLDEDYIANSIYNAPFQDGRLNAYLNEPATYGVTIKKRF